MRSQGRVRTADRVEAPGAAPVLHRARLRRATHPRLVRLVPDARDRGRVGRRDRPPRPGSHGMSVARTWPRRLPPQCRGRGRGRGRGARAMLLSSDAVVAVMATGLSANDFYPRARRASAGVTMRAWRRAEPLPASLAGRTCSLPRRRAVLLGDAHGGRAGAAVSRAGRLVIGRATGSGNPDRESAPRRRRDGSRSRSSSGLAAHQALPVPSYSTLSSLLS